MSYKPFTVVKLRKGWGSPKKNDSWYAVRAKGNAELIRTDGNTACTHITAFSSKEEAQGLADALNETWQAFHDGFRFVELQLRGGKDDA